MNKLTAACTAIAGSLWAMAAGAQLAFPDRPIGIGQLAQPMVMITMGRDHTLSYEAYNDATDIDNNGTLDAHERSYTPKREHLGIFDSYACYTHDGTTFRPQKNADPVTKACGGSQWSGDFLNYLTTSRMDAIRKVLYGGTRKTDKVNEPVVVQASYVPRDAHSWGKLYDPAIHGPNSTGLNALGAEYGFKISDYAPYADDQRHIFARTSKGMQANNSEDRKPMIRVWKDVDATPSVGAPNGPKLNVWNWVGQGRQDPPNQGSTIDSQLWTTATNYAIDIDNSTRIDIGHSIESYEINVEVCAEHNSYSINHLLKGTDPECKNYPGNTIARPVGILQRVASFKDGDSGLNFGLMTGTYSNSLSGGVLRKIVSSLANEVQKDTGVFISNAKGLIATIDGFRISRFGNTKEAVTGKNYLTEYGRCPLIVDKSLVDYRASVDEYACEDWGNPLAGMMYEVVRYFAGQSKKAGPSPNYYRDHFNDNGYEQTDGDVNPPVLKKAEIDDPYGSGTAKAESLYCSAGYNLVISTNPTFDSTDVPGSLFANYGGDATDPGLDDIGFSTAITGDNGLMAKINNQVFGGSAKNIMVGEVKGNTDGKLLPSLKTVDNLFAMRGLSPDDPSKYGSYYSALVAYFGNTTDLRKEEDDMPTDKQKVKTIAAGMASLLPKFKVKHKEHGLITIVPFGKTTHSNLDKNGNPVYPLSSDKGAFQPTMTITDYYIEEMTETSGKIRVNFEDVEQGYDHDMDAIVLYEYELVDSATIKHAKHSNIAYNTPSGVTGPAVKVTVTPLFVAAALELHPGYVISGTHADGVYLETSQTNDGNSRAYYLDTLPTKQTAGDPSDIQDLPYPKNFRNIEGHQRKGELLRTNQSCAMPSVPLTDDRLRVHVNIDGSSWGNEDSLYLSYWNANGINNSGWPGLEIIEPKKTPKEAKKVDHSNFYYTFPTGVTSANIVLHNNKGKQTADINLIQSSCFLVKEGYNTQTRSIVPPPTLTKYFHFSGEGASELESPLWYVGKYGWFTDANGNGKPDEGEWEETTGDRKGLPKGYFQVTDGVSLRKGISAAIQRIEENNLSHLGGVSFSSGSITKDGMIFKVSYRPIDWTGEITAHNIGDYDPDVNASLLDGEVMWTSSDNASFGGIASNHSNRKVYSYNPVSKKGILFKSTKPNYFNVGYNEPTSFTSGQLDAMLAGYGQTTEQKQTELKKRLDYWRGSKQDEVSSYRARPRPLGDIVDSQTLLIGEEQGLTTPLLAVGANDGMLHLMEAKTGKPLFSYVPTQVYAKLPLLLDAHYNHTNFVNGQHVARKLGTEGPTLFVGALGSGGKGLYALNLTVAAENTDEAAKNIVKWEFTPDNNKDATGKSDVGHVFGKPAITRLKISGADRWVVVAPNGYNSDNNKALLYVLDANTGELLKKIDTGFNGGDNNGLSEILVADVNQDGYGDLVYAGDLQGNMWGFDLTSESTNEWSVMHRSASNTPAPLFTASYQHGTKLLAQPITAAPSVTRHPQGGTMVLFGTGKFIETVDTLVPPTPTEQSPVNSFYAVRDEYIAEWDGVTPSELASKRKRPPVAGRTALLQQTFVALDNTNLRLTSNTPVTYGGTNGATTNGKAGWYLDLLPDNKVTSFNGERQVSGSSIRFNKVLFTTIIPSGGACDGGGDSWLMEMDVYQGTSWYNPTIDTNGLSEAQEKQITNRRVEGLAGKTITILAGEKQKEVNVVPTSAKKDDGTPILDQQVSDPNVIGRQSWIQLFMAPPQ